MFAIAIDMNVAAADKHHPSGSRKAYSDVALTMGKFGFERVQWSVYAARDEDLAKLFKVVHALKSLEWFRASVTNIRAFRMEEGSDFTPLFKQEPAV